MCSTRWVTIEKTEPADQKETKRKLQLQTNHQNATNSPEDRPKREQGSKRKTGKDQDSRRRIRWRPRLQKTDRKETMDPRRSTRNQST